MKRRIPSNHADPSPRKPNGHAGANGSEHSSSCVAQTREGSAVGRAVSDDAGEFSVANAAGHPSTASADRHACADLAPSLDEKRSRGDGTASASASTAPKPREKPEIKPLPDDLDEFVAEIHSRVDLFRIQQDLLESADEKIKQRALERILEMKYARDTVPSEDGSTPDVNLRRPQRMEP